MAMTGIFKRSFPFWELEEVKQEHIDAWCRECRFSFDLEKCQDKVLIQKCWFEVQSIASTLQVDSEAHIWHLQHECPFIHNGERCHCNDFKTIKEAFKAAGLEYKEAGDE